MEKRSVHCFQTPRYGAVSCPPKCLASLTITAKAQTRFLKALHPKNSQRTRIALSHKKWRWCPFWHASVVGACGVHKSEEKEMKVSNAIALATSATSRTRNQRMSALASCISVILLLSGAKTQDFARLNKLGVSMSHRQSIRLQQLWDITSMAKCCNGKRIERKFWVLWILVMKLCPSKSPCSQKTPWSWRYGATCLKIPSNCMSSSHQAHTAYSWKWEPSKLMMMMTAVYQIPQSRGCCQS